ncbi:hypothetical protein GGI09_005318 [Coemansia sp. S100]|nr:hypothetical protein LPJ71_002946 [Coemansia sp. S17]KAJ2094594.1 hypothetical protein GGI09_005318 [Coemansia sp. S100]KAJ2098307.1 hypothetical protein GGI16_004319 [Coemansia sp. S142-1]
MFKITVLVYAVSLAAIQAYPVADFGVIEDGADLIKRDGCGGFGCGGSGIQFTASSLFPDLTFSTGGRFNLPGMQPCGVVADQPCATAAPPQQAPPQEMPPQQAPPASGATPCDQAQGQACPDSDQQTPPQQASSAPGVSPCDQAQGQACGSSGPMSLSFNNDQSNGIKASSYKKTTLYYKHKDAKSFSKSGTSSTQLNYSKQ